MLVYLKKDTCFRYLLQICSPKTCGNMNLQFLIFDNFPEKLPTQTLTVALLKMIHDHFNEEGRFRNKKNRGKM